MLIIPIKEGENIDRALKRFKRKFDKTGGMRQLRARKQFLKPSVKNRAKIQKHNIFKAYATQKCSKQIVLNNFNVVVKVLSLITTFFYGHYRSSLIISPRRRTTLPIPSQPIQSDLRPFCSAFCAR